MEVEDNVERVLEGFGRLLTKQMADAKLCMKYEDILDKMSQGSRVVEDDILRLVNMIMVYGIPEKHFMYTDDGLKIIKKYTRHTEGSRGGEFLPARDAHISLRGRIWKRILGVRVNAEEYLTAMRDARMPKYEAVWKEYWEAKMNKTMMGKRTNRSNIPQAGRCFHFGYVHFKDEYHLSKEKCAFAQHFKIVASLLDEMTELEAAFCFREILASAVGLITNSEKMAQLLLNTLKGDHIQAYAEYIKTFEPIASPTTSFKGSIVGELGDSDEESEPSFKYGVGLKVNGTISDSENGPTLFTPGSFTTGGKLPVSNVNIDEDSGDDGDWDGQQSTSQNAQKTGLTLIKPLNTDMDDFGIDEDGGESAGGNTSSSQKPSSGGPLLLKPVNTTGGDEKKDPMGDFEGFDDDSEEEWDVGEDGESEGKQQTKNQDLNTIKKEGGSGKGPTLIKPLSMQTVSGGDANPTQKPSSGGPLLLKPVNTTGGDEKKDPIGDFEGFDDDSEEEWDVGEDGESEGKQQTKNQGLYAIKKEGGPGKGPTLIQPFFVQKGGINTDSNIGKGKGSSDAKMMTDKEAIQAEKTLGEFEAFSDGENWDDDDDSGFKEEDQEQGDGQNRQKAELEAAQNALGDFEGFSSDEDNEDDGGQSNHSNSSSTRRKAFRSDGSSAEDIADSFLGKQAKDHIPSLLAYNMDKGILDLMLCYGPHYSFFGYLAKHILKNFENVGFDFREIVPFALILSELAEEELYKEVRDLFLKSN